VNTPLAVISTYAQMLAKQISGDEQKAPLLEKITRQTFRASEIVNSLLNFSRVSPTEFTTVDPNKVLREAVTLVEHQLTMSGVKIELDLDEAAVTIKGNTGKLQQVLLNLIMNARDAMPKGGTLTLRTKRLDGAAQLSVADTGAGIPSEILPRVFDPFFTTKTEAIQTAEGSRLGTGLGLSVSYGIVREHGGEIQVESKPGVGTRFVLTFPLAVSNRSGPPTTTPAETLRPAAASTSVTAVARADVAAPVPAGFIAQSDRVIH